MLEFENGLAKIAERLDLVFYSKKGKSLQHVTPAFDEIWGSSAAVVCGDGRGWPVQVHSDDRERVALAQRQLDEGDDLVVEYRIVRPDGELRWIRDQAFVVSRQSSSASVVGVARDITFERQLEAKLGHAQSMETIGKLTSTVAHDFNNLLMGIIGCADVVSSRLDDDESRALIERLRAAARGGADILRQLLTFSSRGESVQKPVDLNVLVQDLETMLQHLVGEDIQLTMRPAARTAFVKADPTQLQQVLLNLVVNARQAMPKGGELTVGTKTLTVDPTDHLGNPPLDAGSYAVLTVTDTGIGMSAEVKAQALEPLFTTKPIGQGTGLGLASCHTIVRRHEGRMQIESEPNHGTTFTIYLPTVEADASTERASPTLGGQAGNETVLLVEDEPLVRLSVAHYLGRRGYEVHEAESGAAALECLEDFDVQLLLTDMVLPDMRGPDLAQRARKRMPRLRTLYMSAYPRAQFSRHELADVDGPLLEKPFTEADLVLRVREALHDTMRPPSAPNATHGGLETEPARRRNPRALTPSPASQERLAVLDLLLVEDHPGARLASKELLEEAGHRVVTAEDGSSALSLCHSAQQPPRVIITDIHLPDMDGLDLVRQLRLVWPEAYVIFISGFPSGDPALARLREFPRSTFVGKPFDISELLEAIHAAGFAA